MPEDDKLLQNRSSHCGPCLWLFAMWARVCHTAGLCQTAKQDSGSLVQPVIQCAVDHSCHLQPLQSAGKTLSRESLQSAGRILSEQHISPIFLHHGGDLSSEGAESGSGPCTRCHCDGHCPESRPTRPGSQAAGWPEAASKPVENLRDLALKANSRQPTAGSADTTSEGSRDMPHSFDLHAR